MQRLAPQPRARLLQKDFASGAELGVWPGKTAPTIHRDSKSRFITQTSPPSSKRLAQNCAYVFRCFARNAMSGETFGQTTMSPSFTPNWRLGHQLGLVRSL